MKRRPSILLVIVAGCFLAGPVLAKLDPDESPFLVPSRTIAPQKAQELALAAYHGKDFNKVEIEKEDGRVIYSVEFSDETEVVLDAVTGKLLEVEKPDHEKD